MKPNIHPHPFGGHKNITQFAGNVGCGPDRESGRPLLHSDRIRPQAEESARYLLSSWIHYGPKTVNECDPATMPGILADVAEGVLAAMLNCGARDFGDVRSHFIGVPQGIVDELSESSSCVPPSPDQCGPLIEAIRRWHREYRKDIIIDRLVRTRESGEDPAEIASELVALEAEDDAEASAFPISRASDNAGMAAVSDFVEGLLTDGGASVIYGPSNCGKSFWILDLAVSVATGQPFREEMEVDQGAVVYVALEGSFGVRNRIEALKRAGRLPADAPLFFCFAPVSLLERGHAARLAQSVRRAAAESNLPCRLVILDTLARAMAGGDENSGQDMTAAVAALDVIRAETGAHVAVVHHCGKDEARGARGHSSLRAAVDTEIEVSRPDGETISTVRVTKQRDLPIGEPMPFSLKVAELGADRRGKPITSCVVHHEDSIMAAQRGKVGRKPEVPTDRLLALLPQPSTTAWMKLADAELGVSKSSFYRALEKLKAAGSARQQTGGTWDR